MHCEFERGQAASYSGVIPAIATDMGHGGLFRFDVRIQMCTTSHGLVAEFCDDKQLSSTFIGGNRIRSQDESLRCASARRVLPHQAVSFAKLRSAVGTLRSRHSPVKRLLISTAAQSVESIMNDSALRYCLTQRRTKPNRRPVVINRVCEQIVRWADRQRGNLQSRGY